MKLVLFGTGPFAVPAFQSLLSSVHEVLCLVTRPITDGGKRRKQSENPTRDLGLSRGVDIFDPANVNAAEFVSQLRSMNADLFVVCDYGQILSRECLAASTKGGINLHGSLLPKYRGAAPIQWAIMNGETVTGITIIHMTPKLDGGPCLVSASLPIEPHETAMELEPRLAQLGVEPVHQAIQMLEQWDGVRPIGVPQDSKKSCKAPRLQKSDGQVDWTMPATQIVNRIRAFQPWPGSFFTWSHEKLHEPMRVVVHRATVVNSDNHVSQSPPGTVVKCEKNDLWIQSGNGLISISELQPAGKRMMTTAEFLRGQPMSVGCSLIVAS